MGFSERYGTPTIYDGGYYDSYTEAQWAACFDAAGMPFVREPETYGWMESRTSNITGETTSSSRYYTPDFYLPEQDVLFEVKAGSIDEKAASKIRRVVRCTGFAGIMVDGSPLSHSVHIYSPDPEITPQENYLTEISGSDFSLPRHYRVVDRKKLPKLFDHALGLRMAVRSAVFITASADEIKQSVISRKQLRKDATFLGHFSDEQ